MNKRTLTILWLIFGALVILVVIALIINGRKNDIIEEETEARISVSVAVPETEPITEPETTTEETTTEPETEPETTLSAEELAQICLNEGINGPDREAFLGDRYGEVQKWLEDNYVPPVQSYAEDSYEAAYSYPSGSGVLTPDKGVNYYYGVMETYYNLPMEGVVEWMHSLGYEGEYWVRSDGVKMFGSYVMVASDYDYEPKGTITETSLGLGIVCDTGLGGWAWHDIAVAW